MELPLLQGGQSKMVSAVLFNRKGGFFFNYSALIVIYDNIFSDEGKIFCFAVICADNSHNSKHKDHNGSDCGSDPAEERNDCNYSAAKAENGENKALVDMIAKEFGIGFKKKRYNNEHKIEIAKSGKNIGSSCVFGIEHCGAVAFIGNGVFFKNGFTAGGAIMVVFRNLGSAFRTEHSDDLLFFF